MSTLPTEHWDPEEQLFRAVLEGSFLYELPLGSECGMHGPAVFHPPPDPAWASQRLLSWLDKGLIELREDCSPDGWHRLPEKERIRLWPEWHPVLSTERAHAALTAPARWMAETSEGLLTLGMTDHGFAAGGDDWGIPWVVPGLREQRRSRRFAAWFLSRFGRPSQ